MARGDAKAASRTLGRLLHRAATSPAAMFCARLLVRCAPVGGAWEGGAARPVRACSALALTRQTRLRTRLQVCLYFLNSVWDGVASWRWMRQPEVQERVRRWPQHYPVAGCGSEAGARCCAA